MRNLLGSGRKTLQGRDALLLLGVLISAQALFLGCGSEEPVYHKSARSRAGMVAASTPYAVDAGVAVLERGGNAVDAAMAALFALTVTDPPMTSLGGRCQLIIALADGRIVGICGATQSPADLDPVEEDEAPRTGHQVVPIPGVPAAAGKAVAQYGKLSLAEVLGPAIQLAEEGFVVTPRVGEIWEQLGPRLAQDEGARENYLRPSGEVYRAGDTFRNRRLARVLRRIADKGADGFYQGPVAAVIARDVGRKGGFLKQSDLENYRAEPGEIVRTSYRGFGIATLGRRTWGHTLVEMLNVLSHFKLSNPDLALREIELIARIIAQALEDRPQILGTLEPKPGGIPLSRLASADLARQRAELIRGQLGQPMSVHETVAESEGAETTHISVMDLQGNAVSLTTSIGPRFGSRVATPELGFLYAYSYNMHSPAVAGVRARTEMSPTIVFKDRRPILALGAAGSERIPAAIFQVISQVIDRGRSLEDAVAAPRVFASGNAVRLHDEFPQAVKSHLEQLGFTLDPRDRSITRHLGIVHAVQYDPEGHEYIGAADPAYDGAAGGPRAPLESE